MRVSGDGATMGACGFGPYILRVACEDARGLRAGARIAALGGHSAERKALVGTPQNPSVAAIRADLKEIRGMLEEIVRRLGVDLPTYRRAKLTLIEGGRDA